MSEFITRCPSCQTAFKVQTAQLDAADGTVRCGACLRIFRAQTHRHGEQGEHAKRNDAEPARGEEELPGIGDALDQGSLWEVIDDETDGLPGTGQVDWNNEPDERAIRATAMDLDLDLDDDDNHLTADELAHARDVSAPLDLPWDRQRVSTLRRVGALCLALLLCLTLLAQIVWHQRFVLAQNPTLRPWLDPVCLTLPCELPALQHLDSFHAETPRLRSHPGRDDALLFSLRFHNEAEFDQAFPNLDLVFTDTEGEIVAARRFTPEEYLAQDLQDGLAAQFSAPSERITRMPAQSVVQVTLLLADPGDQAINYELAFSRSH